MTMTMLYEIRYTSKLNKLMIYLTTQYAFLWRIAYCASPCKIKHLLK